VENTLKVRSGEIDLKCGAISTLVGDHSAGKTSLASLIGALAAFNDNPYALNKAQKKAYLHDDADAGKIEMFDDDGEPVCRWDAVAGTIDVFASEADNLKASTMGTVGLVDFCQNMSVDARATFWEGYFLPKPEVVMEKISHKLSEHLEDKTLDEVLELVEKGDLKRIVSAYEIRRKTCKNYWTQITGEHYGAAKAADWIPQGWSADMDGLDETDAENLVDAAKDELRNLQVAQSVSAVEMARAIEAKEEKKKIHEQGLALTKKIDDMEESLHELRSEHAALSREERELAANLRMHEAKKPKKKEPYRCGSCGASLLLPSNNDRVMVVYGENEYKNSLKLWEKKRGAIAVKLETASEAVRILSESLDPKNAALDDLKRRRQELRGTMRTLIDLAKKADSACQDKVSEDEMNTREKNVADAVATLDLVKKRIMARSHHKDILAYDAIIRELGPKGVRSTMMAESMETFTKMVKRAVKITGWPQIEMDSSYAFSIGGRKILRVCGKAARLRAQYIIQISLALSQGERLVILDDVDHLRPDYQKGLYNMIKMVCRRPDAPAFLLCGAEDLFEPDKMTKLETPFHTQYRVDDGTVSEMKTY